MTRPTVDVLFYDKTAVTAEARHFVMVRNARSPRAARLLLAVEHDATAYDIFLFGEWIELGPIFAPGAIAEIIG